MAFRNIAAGQTLLVNLEESITWKELDELKRNYAYNPDKFNYSVLHNTPIRIGNPESVIEIKPPVLGTELLEPITDEKEAVINNELIEEPNEPHMRGDVVKAGEAFNEGWSQGMITPPLKLNGNVGKENFPPKQMNGKPTQTKSSQQLTSFGGSYIRTMRTNKTKLTKKTKKIKKIKKN